MLDADTAILGRIIDLIEAHPADLVVSGDFVHDPASSYMKTIYYDLDHVRSLDARFAYAGFCFNSGHFAIRTGKLNRGDFAGLVEWSTPPRLTQADKFIGGDQGVLNFVAARKVQQGSLSLQAMDFARGGEDAELALLPLNYIQRGEGYPYIIHWSGLKPLSVSLMPRSDLLRFYEDFYYSRIPGGRWTRSRRALLHPATAFCSTLNTRALRTRLKRTTGQMLRRVARSRPVGRLLASDRIYRALAPDGSPAGQTTAGSLPNQLGAVRAAGLSLAEIGRRTAITGRLHRKLTKDHQVKAGLFAGMCYPFPDPTRLNLFPKMLGTYRCELHPHLACLCEASLPLICDVGCGDGYFAIGLARKHPNARVYAFDQDSTARRDFQILADANGLGGNLQIRASAGPRDLLALDFSQGGLLRIGERNLATGYLTPELMQHLQRAHLLLELWRLPHQETADAITERLSATHSVAWVPSRGNEQRLIAYRSAFVNPLDAAEQQIAFAEASRGERLWLLATPRYRARESRTSQPSTAVTPAPSLASHLTRPTD